ncbi:hypothetical protein [Streptomyces rimosus]|uniref:hypothetical protein n=1 Tax=Streptomyces rimosus TaxID=1927 RepID=UPI000AD03761|nr:hypothetical protein [Streptomyces rimosus]
MLLIWCALIVGFGVGFGRLVARATRDLPWKVRILLDLSATAGSAIGWIWLLWPDYGALPFALLWAVACCGTQAYSWIHAPGQGRHEVGRPIT